MTAYEYLCGLEFMPRSETTKSGPVSKAEKRRMLENKAVIINGLAPGPKDEVQTPIWELIFFPNSHRRCTMIQERAPQNVGRDLPPEPWHWRIILWFCQRSPRIDDFCSKWLV